MNSILTKCFSCCGRESEITNSVFNIKENRKISNSFSNIYSKIKSKGSNSVTNLKKTNFKDESNQKKYSFINSVLLSEEDISPKHKIKTENSFSIKKKSTKKKVTYKDEWLCEAYMETDYSSLTPLDFENTVRNFVAYSISSKSENYDDEE